MPTINKRAYVASLYVGPAWKKRVANMDEDQIVAIYLDARKRKEDALAAEKAAKAQPINETLF